MPPPASKNAAMSAVRAAIAVESGVTAVVPDGNSLRSQPKQVVSEATKIALQWLVSIGVVVNAALRGSTTVVGGGGAGAYAFTSALDTSRSKRSSTRIGLL